MTYDHWNVRGVVEWLCWFNLFSTVMSITVRLHLVLHIYTTIYSLPVSQRETLLFTHSSSIHILAILDSQVSNLGMMRWWTCFGWKWRATIRMSMYRFLTNNWHPSKSTHRSILVLAPSTNSEGSPSLKFCPGNTMLFDAVIIGECGGVHQKGQ